MKRVPDAQLVTCETLYGAAYAWKIEHEGVVVIENTRLDACVEWLKALQVEFPAKYAQYIPSVFRAEQ